VERYGTSVTGIPQVDIALGNQRGIHRSNVAMVVMVAVTCLVITISALVLFVKIDAKSSHTETTVEKVRQVQIVNTTRADCQDRAFNYILKDLTLAVAGDKDPTHYAVPPNC
jgi:cell division protein FtsX